MIFKQVQEIFDGTKTQTRRICKSGDELRTENDFGFYVWHVDDGWCGHEGPTPACYPGRVKWQVGRTYAIQPKRTAKSVGRILITDIRQERLNDISEDDAIAEGMEWRGYWTPAGVYDPPEWRGNYPPDDYADLWESINGKGSWNANPLVWVISFEVAR